MSTITSKINRKNLSSIFVVFLCLIIVLLPGCSSSQSKQENESTFAKTENEPTSQSQNTDSISLSEYNLNGISYSIPGNWSLENEENNSTTFYIDNSKDDLVMIRSENIPDIMKIDVGDNAIVDKEDVVDYYDTSKYFDADIIKKEWLNNYGFDYCDIFFKSNAKLEGGSIDSRNGRSTVIPINVNEAVFSIFIISNDDSNLDYTDLILKNIKINSSDKIKKVSIVEDTYKAAISATKADLTGSVGKWYYKGIPLLSDDCEWIDSSINKKGTVNQGVVYRKMAKVLQGSNWEKGGFLYNYKDISDLMFGFIPETVDEYIPLGINASEFIVEKNQLKAIMTKLKKMKSVQGDFDFDYGKFGKFDFQINDLSSCAKEMQISDEMLGFIFAMLDEYGTKITFNGNSCHIEYTSFAS